MKEFDIIDFDKDRGTLELGSNAGLLERFVERTSEEGPSWPLYYLGLAGISLVAVAAAGVAGLLSSLGVVIPLVMLAALGGLSALHFAHEEDINLPGLDWGD